MRPFTHRSPWLLVFAGLTVAGSVALTVPRTGAAAEKSPILTEMQLVKDIRHLQIEAGFAKDPNRPIDEDSTFCDVLEFQRCGGPRNISLTHYAGDDRLHFDVFENPKDKTISSINGGKDEQARAIYPPLEFIGKDDTIPQEAVINGAHAVELRTTMIGYMEAMSQLVLKKNRPAAMKVLQGLKKYCDEHEIKGYAPVAYVPPPPPVAVPQPIPAPVANVAPASSVMTVGPGRVMTTDEALPAYRSHMACYHALQGLPGVGATPSILMKGTKYKTVTFAEIVRTGPKTVGLYTFSDSMGPSYNPLPKPAAGAPACNGKYLYKLQHHLTWAKGEELDSSYAAVDYNPPEKIEPFPKAELEDQKKSYHKGCLLVISDMKNARFDTSTEKVLSTRFSAMIATLPEAVKATGAKKAGYLAAIDSCLKTEAYGDPASHAPVLEIRAKIAAMPEGTATVPVQGVGEGGAAK